MNIDTYHKAVEIQKKLNELRGQMESLQKVESISLILNTKLCVPLTKLGDNSVNKMGVENIGKRFLKALEDELVLQKLFLIRQFTELE